jgi:hypothetical protein
MAKLLRPNEKISFLQTRAPAAVWRAIKAAGIMASSEGTATRLCTMKMLEFMALRPWVKEPWLQPQDLKGGDGPTGFIQVNLPLSNQDEDGDSIVSAKYLKARGLQELFDADKHAYRAALETGDFAKLVRVAAQQMEVSGATFGYTFLHWLRSRPEVDGVGRG